MFEEKDGKIFIDLSKKEPMNESWLRSFGSFIESILKRMFGNNFGGISLAGDPREIRAFSRALKGEAEYLKAIKKYGLNDPRTYKNKYTLDKAISKFERETGIKWPLK